VVREKRAASEMPVTFGAREANMRERSRRFGLQSLHVWSQACVTLLVYDLLHVSHTYRLTMAHVRFVIT